METAYKGKFPVSLKKESIFEHQYKDKLRNGIIITMETKFTIEPSHAKKARMTFDVIMRKTLIKITSFFGKITSVISVHALQCTVKIYL